MKTVRKAVLKKSYAVGSNCMEFVCFRTSAYWAKGTIVEVVCNGKGKGNIVKLPSNEFNPEFETAVKPKHLSLKFI